MVNVKVAVSVFAVIESASVAVTVTVWAPVVVGVPQIVPGSVLVQLPLPSLSRVRPAGKLEAA